jgi:hypothetical protein
MGFNVAICEAQVDGVPMVGSGCVEPPIGTMPAQAVEVARIAEIGREVCLVNAVVSLIRDDEDSRGIAYIGEIPIHLEPGSIDADGLWESDDPDRVEAIVHGHASCKSGRVSRTSVGLGSGDVSGKEGSGRIREDGRVGRFSRHPKMSGNPIGKGNTIAVIDSPRQPVLVVGGIQLPREDELAMMIQALGRAARLGYSTDGGKQERGKHPKDGNDHEQFDQAEPSTSGRVSAGV